MARGAVADIRSSMLKIIHKKAKVQKKLAVTVVIRFLYEDKLRLIYTIKE